MWLTKDLYYGETGKIWWGWVGKRELYNDFLSRRRGDDLSSAKFSCVCNASILLMAFKLLYSYNLSCDTPPAKALLNIIIFGGTLPSNAWQC
jgi:hypothetical protein